MVTKRELSKVWNEAYGETFSKEYPGIYKKLPECFSVSQLASRWKKNYGENFRSNYSGASKLLKPLDKKCTRKK